MKKLITLLCISLLAMGVQAQIGYQVSLLNSATGEPRANETVSVTVAITNSENTTIFSSTQSATTNDFGVLSLQIGNSTTFDNVDWSKLPLFISATVDGVMVGKSQILSVPIAEAAKQLVSVSLDSICKTWTRIKYWNDGRGYTQYTITILPDMSGSTELRHHYNNPRDGSDEVQTCTMSCTIMGNVIFALCANIIDDQTWDDIKIMYYDNGALHTQFNNFGILR